MKRLPPILDLPAMLIWQVFSSESLRRTPEPRTVTDQTENVLQYDQVMGTKLAIAYACGLMVAHRSLPTSKGGSAIDLACGPGHFSLCLARYLHFEQMLGVDYSAPMVEMATHNAAEQGLGERVRFRVADVTRLDEVAAGEYDFVSFTDAAHHMPDLATVRNVLSAMDRIAKPEGLVMVMDLVRLRTAALTKRYVDTLGHDYVQRGLPAFFDDFRNSMYAAWTAKELRQAIPRDTNRYWCHIVPRGLPTVQIVLGLPVGRRKVFVRSGVPWQPGRAPLPQEMRLEWNLLRGSLLFASRKLLPPQAHGRTG